MQTSTHRYGEHADQFAESTRPAGTPRGVAVVVHGGFWKPAYGIEYARPLAPSLAASGWVVWAIEYRRGTGSAAFPRAPGYGRVAGAARPPGRAQRAERGSALVGNAPVGGGRTPPRAPGPAAVARAAGNGQRCA